MAASLPYSLMEGKEGLPSATSTRMRSGKMWRVTHSGVAACSTALVTSSEVRSAAHPGHLGRQIAKMRRNPMAGHRGALDDRFEVQR